VPIKIIRFRKIFIILSGACYNSTMHAHKHDQLVTSILSKIAHQNNLSYRKVKKLFVVYGNPCITGQFWELLKELYPEKKYNGVSHCPKCKKFSLE
jgi:hypothetical protein